MDWAAFEAIGTWVGEIATAGSLWLGFRILLNDRRKAESEQANRVSIEMIPMLSVKEGRTWLHKLDDRVWNIKINRFL